MTTQPQRTRYVSACAVIVIALSTAISGAHLQQQTLPSERPAHLTPAIGGFEYERRIVMIPMRDGVKLHTVILVPKGVSHAPILLTRTPYDADALTTHLNSPHLGPSLYGYDNATDVIVAGGYIRVVQDVRGKYHSEGDYVMNRPLRGPLNPSTVDHATDTYDTIDWLVKNVPETNGKVGILGISYDGFLPLMALFNPHPALKVSVPMNPMVDGWMGDDWFHNGAFREQNMSYIWEQIATADNTSKWWSGYQDDYDLFMSAGSAGELGRRHGLEQIGFWRKILDHPAYDAFWQQQAVDKLLAKEPLKVPVMLVHSLWDQEDIYGAMAVYKAIEPKDTANDKVFLVMGPWHHGQEIEDASALGPVRFGSDTGAYFEHEILAPFLAHFLKDDAPPMHVAPVTAFETGANRWEHLASWPASLSEPAGTDGGPAESASEVKPQPTPLYLRAGLTTSFAAPAAGDAEYRRIRVRSVEAGALPRPPDTARRLRPADDVVPVAGGRSARGLGPPGRADVHRRGADTACHDRRPADRASDFLDQRIRFGLGGQTHRRVSRRSCRPAGDGWIPARRVHGHLPRPLS